MKFTISGEQLCKELNKFKKVVTKRATTPILETVHIEATKDNIIFSGTNLDVTLETKIRVEKDVFVEQTGVVLLKYKTLLKIVSKMKKRTLVISTINSNSFGVTVNTGAISLEVMGFDILEFPSLPKRTPECKSAFIDVTAFAGCINKVANVMSKDENRLNLCGVFLEQSKVAGNINFVATDGHRISFCSDNVEISTLEKPVIINRFGVIEVIAFLKRNKKEQMLFTVEKSNCFFEADNETLITRTIDNNYPNYRMGIPNDNKTEIVINKKDLSLTLELLASFIDDKYKGVKLSFNADSKKLFASTASTDETGSQRATIDIKEINEDVLIRLNAVYVLETLKQIDSEFVVFSLKDDETAALITPFAPYVNSDTEHNFLSVIMPMRL